MTIQIASYSIYHSSNSYLGLFYAYERLSALPVEVVRRPIFIPRSRGVLVADFLGGKESSVKTSYSHEDCIRWAKSHGLPMNFVDSKTFWERASRWEKSEFEREELPQLRSRAFWPPGVAIATP